MIMIMIECSGIAYYYKWNHAYRNKTVAPCVPFTYLSSEMMPLCCQLWSTHYTAVQINNCLKRASAIKAASIWKLWVISVMNGSHHVSTTKLTLFMVSKDEWDTKEGTDTCKSMKNTFNACKRHLLGWSNIKQWKNQAGSLSHCWVTLVWRHQAGN